MTTHIKEQLIRLGYTNVSLRKHLRPILDALNGSSRVAATTPLPPSFPDSEIALMTKEEFLAFRNPGGKYHSEQAYDFDTFSMNRDTHLTMVKVLTEKGVTYTYSTSSRGGWIIHQDDGYRKVVGIVHNGTLYYERHPRFPLYWEEIRGGRKNITRIEFRQKKQVKYLSEYVPLVSNVARNNQTKYPHLIQRIKAGDEFLEVRSEQKPEEDGGTSLAILNSAGLKVAMAQNEWGATLLAVAEEYRGLGLGKVMGRLWYKYNPSFTSGGFTPAGKANAISLWEDRVREFLSRGWYSELVKEGRLSHKRLKSILDDVREKTRTPAIEDSVGLPSGDTGELRYYSDMRSTIILYDSRFLEEQDEKYIYGNVLLRDMRGNTFIYSIDYERSHHEETTYAAFQLARDLGEELYVGEGYGDIVELEGLPAIERVGDYATLTRDIIDLQGESRIEETLRSVKDPYQEIEVLLMEMADAKWR